MLIQIYIYIFQELLLNMYILIIWILLNIEIQLYRKKDSAQNAFVLLPLNNHLHGQSDQTKECVPKILVVLYMPDMVTLHEPFQF